LALRTDWDHQAEKVHKRLASESERDKVRSFEEGEATA